MTDQKKNPACQPGSVLTFGKRDKIDGNNRTQERQGVIHMPFNVEPLPNDPALEFFFNILAGLPKVAQKRRLIEGTLAGCLSPQNCELLMSALRLREV